MLPAQFAQRAGPYIPSSLRFTIVQVPKVFVVGVIFTEGNCARKLKSGIVGRDFSASSKHVQGYLSGADIKGNLGPSADSPF